MGRPGAPAPVIGGAAIVGGAGLVSLAVWEGTLHRQSAAAHSSVAAVIGGGLAMALVVGRGRQRHTTRAWLAGALDAARHWRRRPGYAVGVAVWAVLIATVVAWDLASFVHQAHDLPTLSYEFGRLTRHPWGRSLVFAGWVALGCYLAAGRRRARVGPTTGGTTAGEGADG